MIPLVAVVAVARGGVIGRDNGLPWRMRSDLRHFKAVTLGKPIIMGRKTFESIGKPLPGRPILVVSRQPGLAIPGVTVFHELDDAIAAGRRIAGESGADAVIIGGGAVLYAQALPFCDVLIVSELDLAAEGDARFPAIEPDDWRETSRVHHPRVEGDDASFDVVIYERSSKRSA